MTDFTAWTSADAASVIAVPRPEDDKYSRGVLGIRTGSDRYPGAAVLGVEAALRTGVGMVRYVGPARPSDLVLQRRPEAVTAPGRVQAWLIGSGMDADHREDAPLIAALDEGVPSVLDGGALDLVRHATSPVVLTPHFRELARLLDTDPGEVALAPASWARRASDELGATVLLKGTTTYVAGPGIALSVTGAPAWLATAGAGDALGGVLGALLATRSTDAAADEQLPARLAATAALIHGHAAARASAGGPLTILDLCAQLPSVVADLVRQ
ncbi:NAD(P)H-hydrate dehydratase [Antiquaquibacter oligotrophicus]|uniref:ADP-dependent NAD(P)H-hydrate dehydratase n=1 Tax=Antiquaquibacter oligotrophicus TaxID=2880260 RepID=UPI002AC93096|nr:ADP/ATP-dependent (S)-NAD(P)H-hydrate dehydratase [Antiquaquibacter oligotrophicus]UDF13762.1 NAD(P)H-hydrate dehydratase [Antiquaquibacter oligotrophicus]